MHQFMKYLNDPHDECIRSQNHSVFISKDEIDSSLKFSSDDYYQLSL